MKPLLAGIFAAVLLSWTAPVQPAGVVTHAYRVYRSPYSNPPHTPGAAWTQIASGILVPKTTYVDSNVTTGFTYWYYATDADETRPVRRESAPSNIVSITAP